MSLKVNLQYLNYFLKESYSIVRPFKLMNEKLIEKAIEETSKSQSCLSKKTLCVFNTDSLMNILRRDEKNMIYLDEAEKVTSSTKELKAKLYSQYQSTFKNSHFIIKLIEKCFLFGSEAKFNDNIDGITYIEVVIDNNVISNDRFVNLISRVANILGYNYVDHLIETDNISVEFDNQKYVCSKILILFEASYIDGTSIMQNQYVYHVTSKNATEKIINGHQGLIASNKNAHHLYYPSRIYCFTDNDDKLEKLYINNAKKLNKKFIEKDKLIEEVKDWYILLQDKIGDGKLFDTREFCILQIDLSKLKNTKFYRDNLFEINDEFKAVYTELNIPYYAIENISEFHI